MNINKNTLNCLCYKNVSVNSKFLWILLESQPKDKDGFFYLSQSFWINLLNISASNLKRQIKELSDNYLLTRSYRSNTCGGNNLFIKILYPESLDNMTFCGIFDGYEKRLDRYGHEYKLGRFKDVSNLNNQISLQYTWVELYPEDNNSLDLKKIDVDSYICFNCSVKVTPTSYYLHEIHNIKNGVSLYGN